jgi:EAL domain-containing protein (putative c-di-GMP-specific phosphodiesterase class I)/CHASE2 domain-containing sensor protein
VAATGPVAAVAMTPAVGVAMAMAEAVVLATMAEDMTPSGYAPGRRRSATRMPDVRADEPGLPRLLDRASVRRWMVLVALALCAIAVRSAPGIRSAEQGLGLARDGIRSHAASGRTLLVEIDAKSLSALDHWPWPRRIYGPAIIALEHGGARTIAFDVDFSARSDSREDAAFARAIDRAKVPVVLPTFRQTDSDTGHGVVENLPTPALRRNALLASVNIVPDTDGFVRAYPYGVVTGGIARPSIGAILADTSGRSGEAFPIDGAIDPATVPRISFIDLIHDRVPHDLLRGRNVLIGATAIEMGDRYPTPRFGIMPGALIQILAAETLIAGSSPVDRGMLPALLVLVAGVALALRLRGWAARCSYVGTGATLLVLPLASELTHLGTVQIVPALVTLVAHVIVTAIRSTVRRIRAERLLDLDTGLPNGRALGAVLASADAGTLIALRLANLGDVASVMGQAGAADLVKRIAERVALFGSGAVHRVEDSALAWIEDPGTGDDHERLVEALAAVLRAPVEIAGRAIELTVSFGLLTLDRGTGEPIGKAILAADQALALGARYGFHTDETERETDWRLDLSAELDRAMAAGDIWVAYQPKLAIAYGRVTGTEALVRWQHPMRGAIPPDAFIPTLEASGRILDLTLYVLDRALSDCRSWRSSGLDVGVAVNVSALLPTDRTFMARLETLLSAYPDVVPALTIEVTESASFKDVESAVAALERLAAMGIRLSIDDYGTGQSTLSYLKRLPASEIKIDKSFVTALETSRGDQAMVRSSIALAHELGFKVVAEGVETAAVMDLLASYGCDMAQGWHIGRPVPVSDLVERLTREADGVPALVRSAA